MRHFNAHVCLENIIFVGLCAISNIKILVYEYVGIFCMFPSALTHTLRLDMSERIRFAELISECTVVQDRAGFLRGTHVSAVRPDAP